MFKPNEGPQRLQGGIAFVRLFVALFLPLVLVIDLLKGFSLSNNFLAKKSLSVHHHHVQA